MNVIPQKVSVIIPTRPGRESFLEQAVESVKNQTYKDIEIIVVNEGLPKAIQLNIGIQRSTGWFLAFLDDDDRWSSDKLEQQINIMEKNKAIGLTYTDIITIDEEGKEIKRDKVPEWDCQSFFKKRFICWSSVVIKRSVLYLIKKNGFYLDENLPSADDFDFLVRASGVTIFKRVPGFFTYYRWHPCNISHRFIRSTLLVIRIFWKHHMYSYAVREVVRHLPESILKQMRVWI